MKCPTCNGTHYVPFLKPDGTLSRYARMECPDCGGYDHERSYADANAPDRRLGDFDFACSDTWRGYYNGEPVSHAVTADNQASKIVPETLDDRRWDSVQQLRAQVLWLSKKVTEVSVEKKKRRGEY